MFDGNFAYRAVFKTLTDDETLMGLVTAVVEGLYPREENTTDDPPADAYPFVNIVSLQSEDNYYNGDVRATIDHVYAVYGIQRFKLNGSYAGTLGQIAKRIDDLLHAQTVNVYDTDDETVIGRAYIRRIATIREPIYDGVEYRWLGGNYQVSTNEH